MVAAGLLTSPSSQWYFKITSVAPPVETSKPGACAGGGGQVKDEVSQKFFPRQAGSYCIDPNGETRSYGKDASGSIDKVCTEQFDGECEVYKGYGLDRVGTVRYIDGEGSSGSVSVNLSRFSSPEGAFGFFTKRVVADGDPLENAPKPLEAGAAAALGTGVTYVWQDTYVGELSYVNELEAPDKLAQSSARVLPPIAKSLGSGLPGSRDPLPAVAVLPVDDRISMGVHYVTTDVLEIAGLGAGQRRPGVCRSALRHGLCDRSHDAHGDGPICARGLGRTSFGRIDASVGRACRATLRRYHAFDLGATR